MRLWRHDRGDVVVLELDGRVDGGPSTQLFTETVETLLREGRRDLVLLFRQTRWVNSTGVGVLARNYVRVLRAGGRMVVAELNSRVDLVLRDIFETFDTEAQAVAALRPGASPGPDDEGTESRVSPP